MRRLFGLIHLVVGADIDESDHVRVEYEYDSVRLQDTGSMYAFHRPVKCVDATAAIGDVMHQSSYRFSKRGMALHE